MKRAGIVLLVLSLVCGKEVVADVGGTWGLGVTANYELPVFKLNQWFPSGGAKLGGQVIYVKNETWTVEMEGSWAKYSNGDLEDRTFVWGVDGQEYTSPNAQSEMVWTTGVINWVRHFNAGGAKLESGGGAPYFLVGTGFFRYANKISGLVFPAQNQPPLNTNLVLRPVEDKRAGLGLNLGVGYEYFASSSLAFDFRGQYNLVWGHVRPLEAWGLKEVFPFQKFDVGLRLKLYLAKK